MYFYIFFATDKSDNVVGIKGYGWAKVAKIFNFVDSQYYPIENVSRLIELLENKVNITPDKMISQCIDMLKNNRDIIDRNQRVIDMTMLETPYVYQIVSAIESVFKSRVEFNRKEFNRLLKLDLYAGEDGYETMVNKNIKNEFLLSSLVKKFNNCLNKIG